jgi:acyl-coenzyme A synthetase/AMP-(fatty) acid ligase
LSRSLANAILAVAGRCPDAPALVWHGPSVRHTQTVSYAELVELARRIGGELAAEYGPDVGPLALVAVKSTASLAAILACLAARRPLLLLSPELGEETLAALVRRANVRAVLTVSGAQLERGPLLPAEASAGLPDDTALILTTSGSTGLPKLVPLSEQAVDSFTEWAGAQFALDEGTRVLNYAPLNFDLCLLDIWATLQHGGCVVPVAADRAVDGAYLGRLLQDTEPQVVQAVPLLFRLVTEATEAPFESVRDLILTGDHTPKAVRAGLPRAFPKARLHNIYGCTETNDSMLHTFTLEEAAEADMLPLGLPLPGVSIRLLDGDREVPGAGTGELVVSTPFQTAGYLADDRSAERFERRGDRVWYRTGDLVERDAAGELRLLGRTDFQVKVRGVRVGLEEVERVLNAHEGVAEAAVVALPDDEAGKVLHAFARPVAGAGLTGLRLRAHCAAHLNRLAIPSRFHVVDEPLPVGPTGKTDRRRLEERLTTT